MKLKFVLFALFVFGLSSCAYKTCPTYAKKQSPNIEEKLDQGA